MKAFKTIHRERYSSLSEKTEYVYFVAYDQVVKLTKEEAIKFVRDAINNKDGADISKYRGKILKTIGKSSYYFSKKFYWNMIALNDAIGDKYEEQWEDVLRKLEKEL